MPPVKRQRRLTDDEFEILKVICSRHAVGEAVTTKSLEGVLTDKDGNRRPVMQVCEDLGELHLITDGVSPATGKRLADDLIPTPAGLDCLDFEEAERRKGNKPRPPAAPEEDEEPPVRTSKKTKGAAGAMGKKRPAELPTERISLTPTPAKKPAAKNGDANQIDG